MNTDTSTEGLDAGASVAQVTCGQSCIDPGGLSEAHPVDSKQDPALVADGCRKLASSQSEENSPPQPQGILTIPIELLAVVFEQCIAAESHIPDVDFANTVFQAHVAPERLAMQLHLPFRLAGVCARFREAALGSPRTWSNVVLCIQYPTETSFPKPELLELILSRSRNAPLAITINVRDAGSAEQPSCQRLIERLVQEMPRCAHLTISCISLRNIDASVRLLDILTMATPWLETATIVSDAYSTCHLSQEVAGLFPCAPRLAKFQCDAFIPDRLGDWPSLSRATLFWHGIHDMAEWLGKFRYLRVLRASHSSFLFEEDSPVPSIVLPDLEELIVSLYDDPNPRENMVPIAWNVPKLRTLGIATGRFGVLASGSYCEIFLTALCRWCPGLTRLTVDGPLEQDTTLATILGFIDALPALEELELRAMEKLGDTSTESASSITRTVCKVLSPPSPSQPGGTHNSWPHPHLNSIHITPTIEESAQVFLRFLEARVSASYSQLVDSPSLFRDVKVFTSPQLNLQVEAILCRLQS
ncbi:hypothetical protein BKA62DRAFT_704072 [Auriculariales sp. MPI-PUGE-AT-0066]|nr:hypothetical protein BKA62DRAFT_704072 [Auriculariales sp. MPI-PUGE-AT-0066]